VYRFRWLVGGPGSIPDSLHGGQTGTGTGFLRIFLFPALSVSFLKGSILHLHATLIRRTKGRSLETIQKLLILRISINMDRKLLAVVILRRTCKTYVNMAAACISDILWARHHEKVRNISRTNVRVNNAHACHNSCKPFLSTGHYLYLISFPFNAGKWADIFGINRNVKFVPPCLYISERTIPTANGHCSCRPKIIRLTRDLRLSNRN